MFAKTTNTICISINIFVYIALHLSSYGQTSIAENPKSIVKMYCGTCHTVPSPSDLPKDLWKKTVLPAMGSYYGFQKEGFGLLKKMKPEELAAIKKLNIYPENPTISEETWNVINNYFIENAPSTITNSEQRKKRTKNLKKFKRVDIDLLGLPESLITSLNFDATNNELWIGEDRSMAYNWSLKTGVKKNIASNSVVSHTKFIADSLFILEMGSLIPTEITNGSLSLYHNDKKTTLIKNLHRPVHMEIEDLNSNGSREIIVSNFGNKTGDLSMYQKKGDQYLRSIIHTQAGAVKCLIYDMNNDGLKDIIGLFSQGDESIYIFFQEENMRFTKKKILQFNPLSGSNDFELIDYDSDGDLDIIVAQGDNADITARPKPYHGIRLFMNTNNVFKEHFFFPIYGATNVLAHDFDKDGDVDIVATAFYQDYKTLPNEGLVYLENINSEEFQFQPYSLNNSDPIKAYTLEKGDFDNDGDVDIACGLFSWSITSVPKHLKNLWSTSNYDLTILYNKLE